MGSHVGQAVASDGCRIAYEVVGDVATRKVLVFQHGYTSSRKIWSYSLPYFTQRFACVLIDGRGCGASDKPTDPSGGNYRIEQYAEDIISVVNHLGIQRFSFVGHSMGGAVGMSLGTGPHQAMLEHLVLLTPAPSRGAYDPQNTHGVAKLERETQDRETYTLLKRANYVRTEFLDANPHGWRETVENDLACPDAYYDGSWDSMVALRVSGKLKTMQVPTLMVVGACDPLFGNNIHDYNLLPNASLHVFSRVAHYPNVEVPEDFARVVIDFLDHGPTNPVRLFKGIAEKRAQLAEARKQASKL